MRVCARQGRIAHLLQDFVDDICVLQCVLLHLVVNMNIDM